MSSPSDSPLPFRRMAEAPGPSAHAVGILNPLPAPCRSCEPLHHPHSNHVQPRRTATRRIPKARAETQPSAANVNPSQDPNPVRLLTGSLRSLCPLDWLVGVLHFVGWSTSNRHVSFQRTEDVANVVAEVRILEARRGSLDVVHGIALGKAGTGALGGTAEQEKLVAGVR